MNKESNIENGSWIGEVGEFVSFSYAVLSAIREQIEIGKIGGYTGLAFGIADDAQDGLTPSELASNIVGFGAGAAAAFVLLAAPAAISIVAGLVVGYVATTITDALLGDDAPPPDGIYTAIGDFTQYTLSDSDWTSQVEDPNGFSKAETLINDGADYIVDVLEGGDLVTKTSTTIVRAVATTAVTVVRLAEGAWNALTRAVNNDDSDDQNGSGSPDDRDEQNGNTDTSTSTTSSGSGMTGTDGNPGKAKDDAATSGFTGTRGGGDSWGSGSDADGGNGGFDPSSNPQPILLDLDGTGVTITERGNSSLYLDGGDGRQHRTAWAGAGDGVLFFDAGMDGKITEKREYVFTEWTQRSTSDLVAVR